MHHFRRVGKILQSLFDERHKFKELFLHVRACHIHRRVNAIRLAVLTKRNTRIFRSNVRSWELVSYIDIKRCISCLCDKRQSPLVKLFVRKLADIVSVVELKLLVIKNSRRFVQMLHLEVLCQFLESIEIFSLFIRTTEKSNIVNDSLWQISTSAELIKRS